MPEPAILAAAPFPLSLRNFVPTGLAGELERRFGARVHFLSPYAQAEFSDDSGGTYPNWQVAAERGSAGVPWMSGVNRLDMALKSVHLTGFALEYPDGSLQNLELSRRKAAQNVIARALTMMAPRSSFARRWLRQLYALYRPARPEIVAAFDRIAPAVVLVASPGHYWLDHFVLDEARRRGIPSVCVVLSWDNLYSRGPMCRRPDYLMVWSEVMRRQAIEVHQFPADRISVVGALQFCYYGEPASPGEIAAMRAQIGLHPDEQYLAYICGARTAAYDVEDMLVLLDQLREGPFRDLRVVLRPHPQGSREVYEHLVPLGVLLDRSPDLTDFKTRPEALDAGAIRHMASLLQDARFVVSSWGTTALLEACIFDTASIQLRWMDALPRSAPEEVRKVHDFQRYIHMQAFDAIGARRYCDHPSELNSVLAELEARAEEYSRRRARAVAELTCLPLGEAINRVAQAMEPLLPAGAFSVEAGAEVG